MACRSGNTNNFRSAFENAEFQIEPKERVCLVGRNGTGKTTLLKILSEEKGDIAMTTAERLKKEGMEEGMERGLEKGEELKAQNIAKIMKKNGESISKISQYTGLKEKDIQKL